MFKDIFEIIEYFHGNIASNLKLDIVSSTNMTTPPVWVTELITYEADVAWKYSNDQTICIIEESDVSAAIKFLRQLNSRQEAN
jgi:hypothetical protein